MKKPLPVLVLASALAALGSAQEPAPEPVQDGPGSRPAPASRPYPTKVPTPIHWEPNLAAAHALAKVDGKPVVAYFTFDT